MWLAPASPAFAVPSSSQVTLPFTGLLYPSGVAVDRRGDVFAGDDINSRVLELRRGSASQVTLPVTGLSPGAVAVDQAGDVFFADAVNNNLVAELARGAAPTPGC